MTEFFKNNPIALRHCLLYEFLQGKSAEKAFVDFSQTVGKNVMNKGEIQSLFRRFAIGKFYKNSKKHDQVTAKDIFRNDKKALRTCILYLSMKSKKKAEENPDEVPKNWCKKQNLIRFNPSFVMYEEFRKVFGEDFMEYREFDFWFHRFLNGMYDLNFERDENKKVYELLDMPIDIMKNILEYLDIVDRLDVYDYSVYISFGKDDEIHYEDKENHCVIKYKGLFNVLLGVSYLKKSFRDFKKIFENSKLYVNTLSINSWCEDSELFERCIEDTLKFTHLLHVQHLSLQTKSSTLLNTLPFLKPGYLTTIYISFHLDEATTGELVKMDQWKQAKYLDMSCYLFDGPLRHLYHFHKFTVGREELFIEDVRGMKEILVKSPDFKKCDLDIRNPIDPNFILQFFGGPIGGSSNTCHYPIPDSTEYFEIFVSYNNIQIERKKS